LPFHEAPLEGEALRQITFNTLWASEWVTTSSEEPSMLLDAISWWKEGKKVSQPLSMSHTRKQESMLFLRLSSSIEGFSTGWKVFEIVQPLPHKFAAY
jgi:hypothetical protein